MQEFESFGCCWFYSSHLFEIVYHSGYDIKHSMDVKLNEETPKPSVPSAN